MALKLYYHPLSSFCHKALIAIYEHDIAFDPIVVDFGDENSRAQFRAVWPVMKMPVLRDEARDRTVAESTIVIEYLDNYYPNGAPLIPADADRAWQVRMWDRFYDNYVHLPMQAMVGDRLRPADKRDGFGVDQAAARIQNTYDIIEQEMKAKTWAMGDEFTLADCAASPALFYANTIIPFGETHRNLSNYLDRLMRRPSYARVLKEAEPYFSMFPMERKPDISKAVKAASRQA